MEDMGAKASKEMDSGSKKTQTSALNNLPTGTNEDSEIKVNEELSNKPYLTWQKLRVKQVVKRIEPSNPSLPMSMDCIRFVCISDTHNRVEDRRGLIPDGDVLLHAGDFTMAGTPEQIDKFNTFLGSLPHKVKVVIAGNHDMTLDDGLTRGPGRAYLASRFRIYQDAFEGYLEKRNISHCKELLTNCVYLQDSSVSICGINIYGAPWVPEFCYMGFNVPRGKAIMEKWKLIPSSTDILITHSPPLGRGDKCFSEERAGCLDLLNTVQQRVKPLYHVFGHIHEGHGITSDGVTTFINAAMCNLRYSPKNQPIVFDYPLPEGHSREELLGSFQSVPSAQASL